MDTKTKVAAAAFKDFVDLKKKSLHEDLKLGGSKNMLEKFQETPYVEHTPPASAESGGGPHKRNSRVTPSSMSSSRKKNRGINLSFLLNLNSWMLWSPVWLPMIFVITPPLSEYCNFRTGIFLGLLVVIRWNRGYWGHWLKNATWRGWLYAILVPRLWPTRIERHCDNCEAILASQIHLAENDQLVGWKLRCLRRFPWRILSRNWGLLAHTKLRPHFLNTLLIYLYVRLFNCNVKEAEIENIHSYETLGAFFTRKLKPEVRPIQILAPIVSPADGTTTFTGSFNGGFLEQVKGVHYSLSYFLGLVNPGDKSQMLLHGAVEDAKNLLLNQDGTTHLYQSVIYLSPGDYHRFHSPVKWTVHTRRHFPGELLSVKPSVTGSCPGLFHLNERVSWLGNWQHGFFSMTAVGATNVGSIHFEEFSKDPELKTNRPSGRRRRCDLAHPCSTRNFYYSEKNFENSSENPNSRQPEYDKGQAFGHFAFGSTIVLIFEAPKNFKFEKVTNDRILVGQSI